MATPNLAVFKYKHTERVGFPTTAIVALLAFVAVLAVCLYLEEPFGILVGVFGFIVAAIQWPKRRISLGPRYLICGNTVIYYGNVHRMVLNPGRELVLQWGENGIFRLERERFPTNARKKPKIEKNKTAKFEKVSGKIIERVAHAAPRTPLVRVKPNSDKKGRK